MASAERLIEVFNEAKARPTEAERQRFIAEACAGDPELKQQVLSLLQAHDGASGFLQPAPFFSSTVLITEKPGDRIGRYRLLQKIGEGGCGVVYMAEQEEPVRRRVALKVIKLGMDTKSVVARFEAERQALALMDHPNIAKVFDAGATETGRPYFVMELVRGIRITDYCDQNNLPTEERLKIFTQVCHAIQHAHQKGIIHRDIKPSNILIAVNEPGSSGSPKVIDFGIAKAKTGERLTDKTVFTAFEQFIGTPAYMSPEQAMMTNLDVDTRTDIYALGVLLYELLTGQTPFDAEDLMAAGLDAMRDIIREQEPARPSTRLSTLLAADLTTVASHRHAEPGRLGTLLRGDLDWIVMKCLEKDRARRYETANALAGDIQRHLSNEPVAARPPSQRYRFQKFVRRNKLAFSAFAAVSAALVLGLCVATWALVRERAARGRAEAAKSVATAEALKSKQAAHFLQRMVYGFIPAIRGDKAMIRQGLHETAQQVDRLQDQPSIQAHVRMTLAIAYAELGDSTNAALMQAEAAALRRKLSGDPAFAASLNEFAEMLFAQGKYAEAAALHAETLAMRRKIFGNEHSDVAQSLHNLAYTLARQGPGKYAEAEPFEREALTIRRKVLGHEHPDVARSLNDLGLVLWGLGQYVEAETMHREALSIRRKLFGNEHPDVATSLDRLGLALDGQRRFSEAELIIRESLMMRRKLLGNDDPNTVWSLINLAGVLKNQVRVEEADELTREAQSIKAKLSARPSADPK